MSSGTVAMVTLGCAKNRVESELLGQKLRRRGWDVVQLDDDDLGAESPLGERWDAVVVNTCCFILPARQEAVETILHWAELKRAGRVARLVVAGCLAQRYGGELLAEIPEIDALVGTGSLDSLHEVLDTAGRQLRLGPAGHDYGAELDHASFARPPVGAVTIAGGCSRSCSFCVIPTLRGPYHSRPPELIFRDVEQLVAAGCSDISLVAQDSTSYGRDLTPQVTLVDLMERLGRIPGRFWLRLLYTYPSLVRAELLDLLAAGEPFAPYLDLPLQHMSDAVLRRMRRPERFRSNHQLLLEARRRGLFVRSGFIVGFPGETQQDFARLEWTLAQELINHAGIFVYSPEAGTAAAGYAGQVEAALAEERRQRAVAAWLESAERLHQSLVGRVLPVLADGPEQGWGRHWGQAPDLDGYTFISQPQPGISLARITAASATDFWAESLPGDSR